MSKEIFLSETTYIEFKESLEMTKPKSWLKTVSAFANGIGGCIYWGISDSQNVIGLTNTQFTIKKSVRLLNLKLSPFCCLK